MKYPIGIQFVEKIRAEKYSYVDKTEMIFRIVNVGGYYSLNRPRRFCKSLLLSTFEAYFKGEKGLFEGLAISGLEKDWSEYPVLRLDLNSENYNNDVALASILDKKGSAAPFLPTHAISLRLASTSTPLAVA